MSDVTCSSDTAEEFLRYELQTVPSPIWRWTSKDRIVANIQLQIEKGMRWVGRENDSISVEKMRDFPFKGAQLSDYQTHIIHLGSGRKVMSSIRFAPKRSPKRYVATSHRNFSVESLEDLHAVVKTIGEYYHVFSPEWVSLADFEERFAEYEESGSILSDSRIMVGSIREIRRQPKPARYQEVRLELWKGQDFYDDYARVVDELHQQRPEFEQIYPKSSRQSFAERFSQGGLSNIYISNRWAGLIAVTEEDLGFMHGYIIEEEIVDKRFRGKGFAPALQRKLIERLPFKDDEMIYGNPNSRNIASLRTASRVGRVDVGGIYYVRIP